MHFHNKARRGSFTGLLNLRLLCGPRGIVIFLVWVPSDPFVVKRALPPTVMLLFCVVMLYQLFGNEQLMGDKCTLLLSLKAPTFQILLLLKLMEKLLPAVLAPASLLLISTKCLDFKTCCVDALILCYIFL